jgi:hypothetical protein
MPKLGFRVSAIIPGRGPRTIISSHVRYLSRLGTDPAHPDSRTLGQAKESFFH